MRDLLFGAGQPASSMTRRHCLQSLSALPCMGASPCGASLPDFPGVQLASLWPAQRSPQGHWVSEKFDGVRAVWDGQHLRFRSGRPIAAPTSFMQALPTHPLDGELWLGHGQFDRLSGVVRQHRPEQQAWREVRYWVFDAPGMPGSFQTRHQNLAAVIEAANRPWLSLVEQRQIDDAAHLKQQLAAVVRAGGEGLMLHRADAPWRSGRTDALFKFKPDLDDEAQVVGHLPGQGRFAGMTGALQVRTPEGQLFALGSGLSDAHRRNPPKVGSWVTYRYSDRTPSGLPRFATFVRARPPE